VEYKFADTFSGPINKLFCPAVHALLNKSRQTIINSYYMTSVIFSG
jgi:hypothetical protein